MKNQHDKIITVKIVKYLRMPLTFTRGSRRISSLMARSHGKMSMCSGQEDQGNSIYIEMHRILAVMQLFQLHRSEFCHIIISLNYFVLLSAGAEGCETACLAEVRLLAFKCTLTRGHFFNKIDNGDPLDLRGQDMNPNQVLFFKAQEPRTPSDDRANADSYEVIVNSTLGSCRAHQSPAGRCCCSFLKWPLFIVPLTLSGQQYFSCRQPIWSETILCI